MCALFANNDCGAFFSQGGLRVGANFGASRAFHSRAAFSGVRQPHRAARLRLFRTSARSDSSNSIHLNAFNRTSSLKHPLNVRGDNPDQKSPDFSKLGKLHEHFATAIDPVARQYNGEGMELYMRLGNSWQYLLEFISVFVPHLFGDYSDSNRSLIHQVCYKVLNGVPLTKGRHDVFIGFSGMRYGQVGSLDAHQDGANEYVILERNLAQRFGQLNDKPMVFATYVPTTDSSNTESGGDFRFEMHADPAVPLSEFCLDERVTAALNQRVIPAMFLARNDVNVPGICRSKVRNRRVSLAENGIMQCNVWVGDLNLPNTGVRNLEMFTGGWEGLHLEVDSVKPSVEGHADTDRSSPLSVTLFNPLHTHRGVMWQRALHNYMVTVEPTCEESMKNILLFSGQAQSCLFDYQGYRLHPISKNKLKHPLNAGEPLFKTGIEFSEFSKEVRTMVLELISAGESKIKESVRAKFEILTQILTFNGKAWEYARKSDCDEDSDDDPDNEGCSREYYINYVSSYIALILAEDVLFALVETPVSGLDMDLSCPIVVSDTLTESMKPFLSGMGVPGGMWQTIFGLAHKHVIQYRERYKELRQLTEFGLSMEFRMIIVDKECKRPLPSVQEILKEGSKIQEDSKKQFRRINHL